MAAASAALALTLLLGLQPITTDAMLPALPSLGQDLQAPTAAVQMTVSALILAFGLAQLVWGPVADRVGRRPVLLAALLLYTAAAAGCAMADGIGAVIAGRAAQGASMAAVVVCARAMVRDLYSPEAGAVVMARALTSVGIVAILAPLAGGALAGTLGWRGPVGLMALLSMAVAVFVWRRVPESLAAERRAVGGFGGIGRQARQILRHRHFLAWTALVAASYGSLFVFLSGAGHVLIEDLGLSPLAAGSWMATCPLGYMAGTLMARRWLPTIGPSRASQRAAGLSLTGALALLLLALADLQHPLPLMAAVWLLSMGHGIYNPCGQTGAVAPFPQAAGLAAALAGFAVSATAFAVGLAIGHWLDGTLPPFALAMAIGACVAATAALTGVRRLPAPPPAAPRHRVEPEARGAESAPAPTPLTQPARSAAGAEPSAAAAASAAAATTPACPIGPPAAPGLPGPGR